MTLTSKQRKELKAAAHHLKPVVRIGQNGISDGVIQETDTALRAHELIKVQIQQGERDDRRADAAALCEATGAELVHNIGKIFIIYRENKEKS